MLSAAFTRTNHTSVQCNLVHVIWSYPAERRNSLKGSNGPAVQESQTCSTALLWTNAHCIIPDPIHTQSKSITSQYADIMPRYICHPDEKATSRVVLGAQELSCPIVGVFADRKDYAILEFWYPRNVTEAR